ncbi:cytochrome c3 family protein [Neobacillus drentensis]|uniref:cytochrome c3 family protein n=1 Tax=Neobacillus drentensis TaxID=220684 RepID=UPI0028544421|nr:cytochrome c3 family protein [Neobacillus drentensis]MDR7237735.1 putative CXXCH cytochrome family protein [Neobacillus drentensis]
MILSTISIKHIEAEGDTTPPSITITSPSNDQFVNTKNEFITGQISDDITPVGELLIEVYEINTDDSTSKIASTSPATGEAKIDIVLNEGDSTGTWSFTKEFSEGKHKIYVEAKDSTGNLSREPISGTMNFTLDSSRPVVKFLKLNVLESLTQPDSSEINLLVNEDLTQVRLNSTITIRFYDGNKIMIDETNVGSSVTLFKKSGEVKLKPIEINRVDDKTVDVVFKPLNQDLTTTIDFSPSTTYYILINPELIDGGQGYNSTMDIAGNVVFPVMKKFTTVRNNVINPNDPNVPLFDQGDPHGSYTTNVNTCINCHGTHASNGPKLEKVETETAGSSYCMACHDGTVVAPMAENSSSTHKHDYQLDPKSSVGACTSCHNPHLTWKKENPNLLNSHFTYTHVDTVNMPGTYDTLNVLCESCHGRGTTILKDRPGVNYSVLHYRKSSTATGIPDDFALCFRCHDGTKEWTDSNNDKKTISNIKEYYKASTSQHRLTAIDGSMLASGSTTDGHIPCAECHDTHGSKNIKVLKEKLGHENRQSFTAETGDWNALNERDFCIKCHNGSTALYGVTGKAIFDADTGLAIDPTKIGHDKDSPTACSSCHGGTGTPEEKAKRAAHSPQKGTP